VENISTKALGDQSTSKRRARTKLIDRYRKFVLANAAPGKSSMQDNLPVIDPGDCALGEKVTVADDTVVNSSGTLRLILELEDLYTRKMTEVAFWDLPVQVSEEYCFDPKAEFLLVVNAATDVKTIAQLQRFIGNRLHLKSDLLNLSISGTCEDHELEESILRRYQKKSIIIVGNSYNFQVKDIRYNWELMDPNVVLSLAMEGTSFLFCGLRSEKAEDCLKKWSSLMGYVDPKVKKFNTNEIRNPHKKQRQVLKSLRENSENSEKGFALGTIEEYSPSDALNFLRRKPTDELLEQDGRNLLKHLDEAEPSRRFIVSLRTRPGDATNVTDNLTIAECLSSTTNCIFSSLPISESSEDDLTSRQCALMVTSIPFENLVRIFWNIVASFQWNGISADACYRKLPGFGTQIENILRVGKQKMDDGSKLIKSEV
jgi:hypothetical protein